MDGDVEFDAFVRANYAALVRAARLLAAQPRDAEDLVQSALIRTYSHWGRLRRPEAAAAYARKVVSRLAIRESRRRWAAEHPQAHPNDVAVSEYDGSADTTDVVRRALAELPAEQRNVLVLRYLLDYSEAETARILHCPKGTVKSRANRGIAALRNSGMLEENDGVSR